MIRLTEEAFRELAHIDPILESSDVFSWDTLFSFIPSKNAKRIIVIDEFPYLSENNKSFLSILQKIWDENLSNAKVMLIICGLLIRMMWSQTLNITSQLYGRRTASMRIHPIAFEYYSEFYQHEFSRLALLSFIL